MAKILGKHSDGGNCYTANCSRRLQTSTTVPSKEEFVSSIKQEQKAASAAVDTRELDENLAYLRSSIKVFPLDVEDIQMNANQLVRTSKGVEEIRTRFAASQKALADKKEELQKWVMTSESKQDRLDIIRAEVGAYQQALNLHEEKVNPDPERYVVYFDNGIGGKEHQVPVGTLAEAFAEQRRLERQEGGHDDTVDSTIYLNDADNKDILLEDKTPLYHQQGEHGLMAVISPYDYAPAFTS